ncbi:hypothetical protein GALL_306790 [mine drainage metagenome]|uniref:DUF4012 domain-containing protein n=1 Tax=mine drainage metagenome TaxID=410659 RepID=A0A1J5QUX7_9ZZZZ
MSQPLEEPDPSGVVPRHVADPTRRRSPDDRRGARGRRRRWFLLGGVVALLVLAAVASLGYDALRARDAADAAKAEVRTLQSQVEASDSAGASATLVGLQAHARTAYARTHGPLWSAAALVPWAGADVRAVQTVSTVVDDLAAHVLPSLMKATTLVDPATLAPVHGKVNLAPLVAAAPEVTAANDAVQAAAGQLEGIDTHSLVSAVAGPVNALRSQVNQVAVTTATAARAVQLIPPMLGADGPRNYLVLVQNNAEPRATGGIPGSVLHLRADQGAVTVVEERSGGSLAGLATPALPLTPAEDALFGPLLGTDMRDVTFTPDFTRSAALARAIWLSKVGGPIDGVFSVDPGALALVLGATGPVALPDGTSLTSENAVATLLNTVYRDIADPAQQDRFFAATSGAVFSAVVSGQGKGSAVLDALAQGAREGRVMLWSAHANEQALLAGTVLSGQLRGTDGRSPVIGVYLNDGTEAKMGYYLDLAVTGMATACLPDGSQRVHLEVSLTSTAPADAAGLPPYLTGGNAVVPPGETRTNVLIYAPTGGLIESSRVKSGAGAFAQIQDGLSVQGRTIDLKPGGNETVTLDILTGKGQTADTVIRATPTARGALPATITSACG